MYALRSGQVLKAIVLKHRRGLRLFAGKTSLQTRSLRNPFIGPPTYARRFFSDIDLPTYFSRKRHQVEARDRCECVDIHDIGGVDPGDFDVLISDVDDGILRGEVAEKVGRPYHAEATKEEAEKVVETGDCYLYGRKLRTIFPAVVVLNDSAHWVFFILDTGSPLTYLSTQTSDLFGIKESKLGSTTVKLAGHHHAVYRAPEHLHFSQVNLLGIDFCNAHHVSPVYDFENSRAKLYFGKGWKMVKESKM